MYQKRMLGALGLTVSLHDNVSTSTKYTHGRILIPIIFIMESNIVGLFRRISLIF